MAEKPLAKRIGDRDFPSVFQAWNPADDPKGVSDAEMLARHDLIFHSPDFFGLRWDREPTGLTSTFAPDSLTSGRKRRAELLKNNPNAVLIAEIRYRDAHISYLPEDHAWWKRDARGKRLPGWEEGGYWLLDFASPAFRAQVAMQCRAAIQSGVLDGVMLDWWDDDPERLTLVKEIRAAIGPTVLILANANDRQTPRTASFINGFFLECYRSKTPEDWRRIAETLLWAEKNLRAPRVNCLESWYHQSRDDLALMRTVTTLSLCLSGGYCLFSDPNDLSTPDHLHRWYPFWNKSLGKPTGKSGRPRPGRMAARVPARNRRLRPARHLAHHGHDPRAAQKRRERRHSINAHRLPRRRRLVPERIENNMLDEFDAVAAAPEHHKVLLENDRVRVLETIIHPGDETAIHTHIWSGSLYIVSWSDAIRYDSDRNVMVDFKAQGIFPEPGTAAHAAPLPLHSLKNVGDRDIHVILTELKTA